MLINNSIAVEVRRLNQFKIDNGIYIPLENLEYRLMPKIRQIIKSYHSRPSQLTAYVSVRYKRPLTINNHLFSEVERVLNSRLDFLDQFYSHRICDNLELVFRPSKKKYNKPYVWASSSDEDGGGAVVSNMLDSLKFIIKEKELLIQNVKGKYPSWWLALNDHIGFGIDEMDLLQLKSAFNVETFFEKIIFISAFDSKHGMELSLTNNARSR